LRAHQRSTVLRLNQMPKPTISAINGYAFGAGLSASPRRATVVAPACTLLRGVRATL